jgi:hypothetical protein
MSGRVNPYLTLAQAIVYQAILDWQRLDAGLSVPYENYITLRKFFNSAWCATLLSFTDIEPRQILEALKNKTVEV